ncbi:BgTH12-03519 [Blumeria graminis f. sp. triticale]|uniref:Bgt-5156 n=3 Tax=Blumeria graminis TaxID=34373 RepID=A0A381L9H2_BLUGR|nr:hypothetical protein BGT96224_5156 [Blumeria graminis f. sp. tritici 96224]CAD6499403.1 BgTH12-03519 [Blumeria graminis f. sp. triticale]VCU39557.1 Bgt-5156 [Blumeria graminis f. sp. tritici]
MFLTTLPTNQLVRRAYGHCVRNGRYGHYSDCRLSYWSRIGRWILAGVMFSLAILTILVTVCCIARRRKRNVANARHQQGQLYYQPPADAPPKYSGHHVAQPQSAYVR